MNEKVYCYIVCWQESPYIFEFEWKHKHFASKKDAQNFARKKKNKAHKPYPYIIQDTVNREFFKKEVLCEVARNDDRKVIKY